MKKKRKTKRERKSVRFDFRFRDLFLALSPFFDFLFVLSSFRCGKKRERREKKEKREKERKKEKRRKGKWIHFLVEGRLLGYPLLK